jgi:hypothetical protein
MNPQQLDALCASARAVVAQAVRESAAIAATEVALDFYWLRQRLLGARARHRHPWRLTRG